MSARRSSQLSVQLFPFLAVLMCALGALILLLLVVTSRMRDQVRAEKRQQMAAAAVAQQAAVAEPEPELPPERDRWQPSTLPPDVRLQPVPEVPAEPQVDPLREQWLRTVTDLQAAAAAEEAALRAARAAAEAAEQSLNDTSAQLAKLQQNAAVQAQRLESSESDRRRDIQRLEALELAVERESTALSQLQEQRKAAASKYNILPYDGRIGTVRRPIYIECTETGLTFASEQITLTPEQLNGYAAVHNPLRAGADALIDYWSVKALKQPGTESVGPPYILLIVRPKGTIGYYVARRMLEAIGQQFGYELVSDDLQLQWPPTDPEAAAACRAAIEAALQERDRFVVRGYAPPGSLEPLSVSDGSGSFALEEVDRLRGSGKKVNIGGREFDRTAQAPGAGGLSVMGPGRRAPGSADGSKGAAAKSNPPPPAPGAETSGEEPAAFPAAMAANGKPAARNGQQSDAAQGVPPGATASPPGQQSGAPSPEAIAANAAAGFSSAVGNRGRGATNESTSKEGNGVDPRPSPLQSLDALEAQELVRRRPKQSNPADVLRDPGSQIGLERKVNIRVEAQRITVESELPIVVGPGMSSDDVQSAFALALQEQFIGWGRPPRSFYWLPKVQFTVLPGGQQNLKRLTDLTEKWEMSSKTDYALE